MRKYQLETQLFCLYYSPVIIITFISFGLYILLFEQLKSITNNQESSIYLEQQQNKKILLMGMKAHLDQSMGMQSQEYYILSRLVTKVYENKINFNLKFEKSYLNLDNLFENQDTSSLVKLYVKNPILVTIWLNQNYRQFSQMPEESQIQLNKSAVLDVLIRNYNVLNIQRTFQYKDQFLGFQLDGGLIANPAYNQSMSQSFQSQTLCTEAKYYDPRCRIWYQQASVKQSNYMPAPFKVLTTKIPYMSLSLCRRNNAFDNINSVVCQSFNIEQLAAVFQKLEIQTGQFEVIHPTSKNLIYSEQIQDYQQLYNWDKVITLNMTQNEAKTYIQTVNNQLKYMNENNFLTHQQYLNQLENIYGFEYFVQGDARYSLMLPIQIADIPNGQKQVIYSNIMVMMYTFRKQELIQNYNTLFFYLGNAFIANSVFYLILLIVCLLIIMFYSKKFSQLIELPIQNLIDKLHSLNQHLLDRNGISSQDEIVVVFDNKYSKSRKYQHTCSELTNLERYITNIQDIFNFNFNYNEKIDETTALFTWIKAIKTFQQVEDYKALGSAYNNIANIHFNNQRYTEALDCYNQSIVYLEQERAELIEGQQTEKQISDANSHNRKDSIFTFKKFSDSVNSNNQLAGSRKKSLIPWIEKYLCRYLDGNQQSSSKIQVLQNAQKNLESLKFDRLFAYSQVLLQCYLENRMEHEIFNHGKKIYKQMKQEYYYQILQEIDFNSEQNSNSLKSTAQKTQSLKVKDEAMFTQYFQVLKKLLKIAKNLDNDYTRYILIYLEISKAFLLSKKIKLSQKYLDYAFQNFLELYKRIKASLFSAQNKPSAHFYNQYLMCLNQILVKRFSSEEVNEEININNRSSPSKTIPGKQSIITQKLNSSQNNLNNSGYSHQSQQKRKSSKANSNSPQQATPLNDIQPIIEDHMESQEEIHLNNINQKNKEIQEKSIQIDKCKRERQNSSMGEINTIYNHLTKKFSSSIIQNTPTASITNLQRRLSFQNGFVGSYNQQICLSQGYSPKAFFGTSTTEQNLFTNQSLSYEHPIHKMYLQNNPTENFIEDIKVDEEQQPINYTKQQLNALDDAIEAFNNSPYTNQTSWYQKTSYNYPIDILYTKLQIQEALIEIHKRNFQKGCTLLTDAFEFSPRYLSNDRMAMLNILQYVYEQKSIDFRLIQKQAQKFQQLTMKISIIVNCEPNYLKRVSKQLYDIYQLSDTFSLVMVNEQIEQYIAPINQLNFKGKETFINNIMKYLRFKHISSKQQFFLSALQKASLQFQNINRLQNQEIQKKYILIFGDRDCIFREAIYKNKIFSILGQNKVKILIFNPQDDKEGIFLNLQCLELPFKVRFFFKFYTLIDYLKKKSIKSSYGQPFLIEKI
ncbi:tetratricopeptide repeat protein (macronuclear) [Tetrahymena thermophila SB210]|uniref:Tetratricopeptide repeat protein n=1 Tax=Tetrahymena thermophila (strain SB210) TaxID=312017 RepID=I7M8A5_TETTS|nr:tetratricopeptide repeat protein [Tetrahymena thermophila SB210]EAR97506.2 tetratricopeptide repeat protein [Tetrahymena thermophila SB210]|eukprot:XP_001017751.2 tetratricopeptide repeat protein [Tetrahymena thermophila SB210]